MLDPDVVGDDRAVGLPDDVVVRENAAMGVKGQAFLKGDGVHAPFGPGELHPVANAKESTVLNNLVAAHASGALSLRAYPVGARG